MPVLKHKWYIDYTSPGTAHLYAIERYVESRQTAYQAAEIADTELYGRILFLDGKVQSAEKDEYIYHEALVHPAMLLSSAPVRVLVIGGGEGATLREVFKHPAVEHLTMVDLDREVVELCQKHLKTWHRGSFEDSRLELVFMDAREYLVNNHKPFDVIISDVPEPVEEGPAVKLFTTQYFSLIKKNLTSEGYFVLQAGDFSLPFIGPFCAIANTLGKVMSFVRPYRAFVPSFNSEWGFILSSAAETALPDPEQLDALIKDSKVKTDFFDGETFLGMFALPGNVRKLLSEENRVIDDENPVTIF